MKHHDLGCSNFLRMISGAIKLPTSQLLPILVRQSIPISKRFANISGITGIRSLFLLLARKNRPIHHRTIGNHFLHASVKRSKQSRRSAKTSPDHKHFIDRHAKKPPKRKLSELLRQPVNQIQNVFMRRFFQKLPATLPSSAISRIKHPIPLPGKKFGQRLFARDRRHPIAEDDRPLHLPASSRRQEFSNNVACESRPEHGA